MSSWKGRVSQFKNMLKSEQVFSRKGNTNDLHIYDRAY